MNDATLRVRNLTVKLRIEGEIYSVVEDISFDLKGGQTVALVGESGCGKSMTALSLMRILPEPPALPPEGEVLYRGQNLLTLKESHMRRIRGRSIAMIFQDPMSALNPVYTIGSQLLEVAWTHMQLAKEDALPLISKALEDVHLPDPKGALELYPHQLSGGMLQRAMIAMALICSPDILIADEPTTALDATIQMQILNLLKELQDKKGMATLLITHDMNVVAQNADEIIVMYAKDHIEKGSLKAIFEKPAHPYTQALFASRPIPNLRKKKLVTIPGFVPRITEPLVGCPFHPRCRYVMELCKSGKVPQFSLKEKGHSTKCWLYDKELKLKL
jgi:oligopeptide/dipeptide ABC transporter ATP-binding protein